MFTGLIERIGRVVAHSSNHDRLTIELIKDDDDGRGVDSSVEDDRGPSSINTDTDTDIDTDTGAPTRTTEEVEFFRDLRIGDSVAIDGVCLTLVSLFHPLSASSPSTRFEVNLAPETLSRSNLGSLVLNDPVNLERALSPSTRFGGHFVQGHIDQTGTIVSKVADRDSIRMTIEYGGAGSARSTDYLIPKGYVTIDGISLTITSIDRLHTTFSIMLIPHTQAKVVLATKSIGQTVNIEFDMLVKSIVNVIDSNLDHRIRSIVQSCLERPPSS